MINHPPYMSIYFLHFLIAGKVIKTVHGEYLDSEVYGYNYSCVFLLCYISTAAVYSEKML